jgi:HTH-type transcriptional regulator / antitoxin MqsA
MPDTRIHPETGAILRRDIRPFPVGDQMVDVPGWYPDDDGDAIFEADGLAVIGEAQKGQAIGRGGRRKTL